MNSRKNYFEQNSPKTSILKLYLSFDWWFTKIAIHQQKASVDTDDSTAKKFAGLKKLKIVKASFEFIYYDQIIRRLKNIDIAITKTPLEKNLRLE